jgi:hypothetical protein
VISCREQSEALREGLESRSEGSRHQTGPRGGVAEISE